MDYIVHGVAKSQTQLSDLKKKKKQPFHGHKFDNADEMNQFFQKLNLPKFTTNINRPIISFKMIK